MINRFPPSSCRQSPLSKLDVRVKLVLLLAYTIALFCLSTWIGLIEGFIFFLVLQLVARVPFRLLRGALLPLTVLLVFILAFNSIRLMGDAGGDRFSLGTIDDAVLVGFSPIPLGSVFEFLPSGFELGCFYSIRILLLVLAGLIFSFSSSPTELTRGFAWFLRPLGRLGIKSDDIAMTFSLALRFIPLTMEELERLRRAQLARAARLEHGPFWQRLRAWTSVFVPLFYGLFRRAESVALSFDLRCYGASKLRTSLHELRFSRADGWVLCGGLLWCVLMIVS